MACASGGLKKNNIAPPKKRGKTVGVVVVVVVATIIVVVCASSLQRHFGLLCCGVFCSFVCIKLFNFFKNDTLYLCSFPA
jgi:hypothetical protein